MPTVSLGRVESRGSRYSRSWACGGPHSSSVLVHFHLPVLTGHHGQVPSQCVDSNELRPRNISFSLLSEQTATNLAAKKGQKCIFGYPESQKSEVRMRVWLDSPGENRSPSLSHFLGVSDFSFLGASSPSAKQMASQLPPALTCLPLGGTSWRVWPSPISTSYRCRVTKNSLMFYVPESQHSCLPHKDFTRWTIYLPTPTKRLLTLSLKIISVTEEVDLSVRSIEKQIALSIWTLLCRLQHGDSLLSWVPCTVGGHRPLLQCAL